MLKALKEVVKNPHATLALVRVQSTGSSVTTGVSLLDQVNIAIADAEAAGITEE